MSREDGSEFLNGFGRGNRLHRMNINPFGMCINKYKKHVIEERTSEVHDSMVWKAIPRDGEVQLLVKDEIPDTQCTF